MPAISGMAAAGRKTTELVSAETTISPAAAKATM